jgi:L-cystine uptake protein TcyP (sodium:dicarboxylate symporter family)
MRFERKEIVAIVVFETILGAVLAAILWNKYPSESSYNRVVLIIESIILLTLIGLLLRLARSRWKGPIVDLIMGLVSSLAIFAMMGWLWHVP